ncbi:hypothetical protein PALA111701_10745 [Paenibacillus lactis]
MVSVTGTIFYFVLVVLGGIEGSGFQSHYFFC